VIEKVSEKILSMLITKEYTQEQKEVLLFGITRIVEDIPKIIGIVIIGMCLDIIKEIGLVTIILALYKTFTGGVHAKTNFGCFIYSALFYLIIIYTAQYIVLTNENQLGLYALIYFFSLYTIFVYVPADVPEVPKVNLNLRKSLKRKALVMLNIIYVVALFVIKDTITQNLIIFSIFYISLMTTRTIYKCFRAEYGFETYVPDELI